MSSQQSGPNIDDHTSAQPIGLTSATFLVVANMIGAGVFTTSGFSLASLGSPIYVWLAWVIGGGIAICGAICYGALGKHFRQSGGEYLFLSRAIHPAAGFIAGWVSLFAGFTGAIAFAAKTFPTYCLPLFDSNFNFQTHQTWYITVSIGVIALAASAHSFRFKFGLWTQNILVAIKLGLLAYLIGVSLFVPSQSAPNTPFHLGAFAVAVMWISLSYTGYNAVVYAASEVKDVERTLPQSTMLGTCLVTLIYLLLNYVFVFKVPNELITGQADIAALSARHIGGNWLEIVTRVVISLATLTSVFAMIMLGPRVYSLMARDGWLPGFLQHASAPAAIWFQALLAIAVVPFVTFQDLLSYLGLTLSLCAALSVCSLFVLRYRGENISVIFWPWPPLIFMAATLTLTVTSATVNPGQVLAAVGTIAAGLIAYQALLILRRTSG